jgi:hypothetical protein
MVQKCGLEHVCLRVYDLGAYEVQQNKQRHFVSAWPFPVNQTVVQLTNLILTLTSMPIQNLTPTSTQLARLNLNECCGSSQLGKSFCECIVLLWL